MYIFVLGYVRSLIFKTRRLLLSKYLYVKYNRIFFFSRAGSQIPSSRANAAPHPRTLRIFDQRQKQTVCTCHGGYPRMRSPRMNYVYLRRRVADPAAKNSERRDRIRRAPGSLFVVNPWDARRFLSIGWRHRQVFQYHSYSYY